MSVIYFVFQQTLLLTTPLLVVALDGMFSERSDVVNIALEGIMTMGVFTGALFLNMTDGKTSGQFQLILAILIVAATGDVFALFHAYATTNMKADQVISGTTLNMFAPAFATFTARVIQRIQQTQFTDTFRFESVPVFGKTPMVGPMLFQNAYITIYIGIAILVISAVVLYKTRSGFRPRSCDECPQAADAAGINVYRMQCAGATTSEALAGLGELVSVVPTSTNFNATMFGYGFLALTVLIFGQRKPVKILYAPLFFGLMGAVTSTYSGTPFLTGLEISSYFYKMILYTATLVVLILMPKNPQAPRASGVPYDKRQRQKHHRTRVTETFKKEIPMQNSDFSDILN